MPDDRPESDLKECRRLAEQFAIRGAATRRKLEREGLPPRSNAMDMMQHLHAVRHNLLELEGTNTLLELKAATEAIRECRHTIWLAGNGGSHCNAEHFACDLWKMCGKQAMLVMHNPALMLAMSNDLTDARDAMTGCLDMQAGKDLVIVFSTSGNSINVLRLAHIARTFCKVIAFTGFDGGLLKDHCDIHINVPVNDVQIVEDIHGILMHSIIKSLC